MKENAVFLKKSGILFRNILNDLKRDEATAARELNLQLADLQEMLNGKKGIPYEVIQKAVAIWPVNERDFFPLHDDTDRDVLIYKSEQSRQSKRVLSRGGKAYYEYRDTAMSRLALFRPEWIEMLVKVDDADPLNPAIQWNKGHFLYQFTFFVGPINYYYEAEGKKYCVCMQTGDTVFGLPYFPHTFAKREESTAFILALTFGNRLLGDAQQELVALGAEKAVQFCLEDQNGLFSLSSLLEKYRADASLPLEELSKRTEIPLSKLTSLFQKDVEISTTELEQLAKALGISLCDLLPIVGDTEKGIKIQSLAEAPRWCYPNHATPQYIFLQLARSRQVTGMQPLIIQCLTTQLPENFMKTSLHQYGYHIGTNPLTLSWIFEGSTYHETLEPGDSFYIKPFVLHSFTKKEELGEGLDNALLILRISGRLAEDEITEASLLGSQTIQRFVSDAEKWYA